MTKGELRKWLDECPLPDDTPVVSTYLDESVDDAKAAVCEASPTGMGYRGMEYDTGGREDSAPLIPVISINGAVAWAMLDEP